MIHKTKGIVLRSVKYGETSLVVSVFTELFGIQTYMVNGVRAAKKHPGNAIYFQPAALLDLVVYHQEQKSMQRIKEFSWSTVYRHTFNDVIRNSIALYLVELLHKCLKQPEQNTPLFEFCEDVLHELDSAESSVAANLAMYFALQLPQFFGFRINDGHDEKHNILDLQEGCYVSTQPAHPYFIDGEKALITSQLLKVMLPIELSQFRMNHEMRRKLLQCYHDYYALHIPDFGQMKTLAVLNEVL